MDLADVTHVFPPRNLSKRAMMGLSLSLKWAHWGQHKRYVWMITPRTLYGSPIDQIARPLIKTWHLPGH